MTADWDGNPEAWGQDIHAAFALLDAEVEANQTEGAENLEFEEPELVSRSSDVNPNVDNNRVFRVSPWIVVGFLLVLLCLLAELAVRHLHFSSQLIAYAFPLTEGHHQDPHADRQ